jgi:propionate CoA-transferase
VDPQGNVNISRFGDKIVGIGGFVNISQNARKVVFSGTFTSGGLKVAWQDGTLQILSEGRHGKFVSGIEQNCYNARFATKEGRKAVFVTERAVFRLTTDGLELFEVAPGIDVERDICAHMAFRPRIASILARMDVRLFKQEPMGLKGEIANKAVQSRQPRRRLR